MGVRLYDAVTGLFASLDPVAGGNPNAYTYPTDPINSFDLDGKSWRDKLKRAKDKAWGGVKSGARSAWGASGSASKWLTNSNSLVARGLRFGCSMSYGVVSTGCSAVYGLAYARQGRWAEAAGQVVGLVVGDAASGLVKRGFSRAWNKSARKSRGRWKVHHLGHRSNRGAQRAIRHVSGVHGWAAQTVSDYYYKRRFGSD